MRPADLAASKVIKFDVQGAQLSAYVEVGYFPAAGTAAYYGIACLGKWGGGL
jgi:hypothetical protein